MFGVADTSLEPGRVNLPDRPLLQLALDVLSTAEAVRLAERIYPRFDIAEVGTPLIIEEGLAALEAVKSRCPDKAVLADVKIMDAGAIEANSAFARGADIVTVLAAADDTTVRHAVAAAGERGGLIMADLINVADVGRRASELAALGVHILCVHTAFDRQAQDVDPFAELRTVTRPARCRLAVAGGMSRDTARPALEHGADILVVGGAILGAADPAAEAGAILAMLAGRSA